MATSVFAGDSPSGRAMAEINITPLVDVMLVLLVIFMVTAPLLTRTLDVGLPQQGDANTAPPRVLVSVRSDGSYALDGRVLSRAALQVELTDIARGAPRTIVEITASEQADYQAFTAALSAARASGITGIALAR